jgi:hypothetical protein
MISGGKTRLWLIEHLTASFDEAFIRVNQWSRHSTCSVSSFSPPYRVEFSLLNSQKSYGSNVSKLSKVLSLFYPTSSSHSKAGNTTAADNTLQINAGIANDWGEFLASLNRSLDPLDLELSRIRNEVTGKEMYALVRRRFALPELPNNHPHVVNVEYGSRSIVGTMKLLVSRATIRPSRYPTSEHWYVQDAYSIIEFC